MACRAVITGLGVIAANGIGCDAFWNTLQSGQSGIRPISLFNTDGLNSRIAGEVRGLNSNLYLPSGLRIDRMARASQFAIAAVNMAIRDARFTPEMMASVAPIPFFCGVSTSAMELRDRKPRPWFAVSGVPHAVGSTVASALNLSARLTTLSNGCASGLDAVAAAAHEIADGRSDLAIALAADSSMSKYVFECFCAARKLSRRNEDPQHAGRPFDRDRDGGIIAEGGGAIILERLEHARARGVSIYGEPIGYGTQTDDWSGGEGNGLSAAMQQALDNAACLPEQIDAVSAHAPSDPWMDAIEVSAVKQVLGQQAWRIPVTSIKGATGNAMGVGGMHQIIAALLAMRTHIVPATTNLVNPDPKCDLDHVAGRARHLCITRYLVNTHGFGRGNSSLILRRIEPVKP